MFFNMKYKVYSFYKLVAKCHSAFMIVIMLMCFMAFAGCNDEPDVDLSKPYTFPLIEDARAVWASGTTFIRGDTLKMTAEKINGKSYLRMLRNGERTNICIRVERDRIFGLNPNDGSEFLMYDFTKDLKNREDFVVNLFYEHPDGSVDPIPMKPEYGNDCHIDGGPTYSGEQLDNFHLVAYFNKKSQRLKGHCLSFFNKETKARSSWVYVEYLGLYDSPLYIEEGSILRQMERDPDAESYVLGATYHFYPPGKGRLCIQPYYESDGVFYEIPFFL